MIGRIYGVYHKLRLDEPLYIGSSDRRTVDEIWKRHKSNAKMQSTKIGEHILEVGIEHFFIGLLKEKEYLYNRKIKEDVAVFKDKYRPPFNKLKCSKRLVHKNEPLKLFYKADGSNTEGTKQ